MKTTIIKEKISDAAEMIARGELVAVPTETVYGLAGNGLCEKAVEQIYEVKGRPQIKPLSLMVPDSLAMDEYCENVPKAAKCLADKFWPGPLTIVLKSKPCIPDIVRAGGETVGLRCPDHPMTLELMKKVKLPLAAPSANPSGEPSPKTAGEVLGYFDGEISGVIDGGVCSLGTESTIIDMSRTPYRILRSGALSEREIKSALASQLKLIGITGGTGCGKTTALNALSRLGVLVIDCDEVYHRLLSENDELLSELRISFPAAFEGGFDRKKLGGIVFGDAEGLSKLNEITHRYVMLEIKRLLGEYAMAGGKTAALDAVALIESGLAESCDITVGVISERSSRTERIMKRDGISREYAEMRINAQKPDEFYIQNCDHVLRNDGTESEFTEKCLNFFKGVSENE